MTTELSAVRNKHRRNVLFKEIRYVGQNNNAPSHKNSRDSPTFEKGYLHETPSFKTQATSYISKRDINYDLKKKVKAKIFGFKRHSKPENVTSYQADFKV